MIKWLYIAMVIIITITAILAVMVADDQRAKVIELRAKCARLQRKLNEINRK